MGRSVVASPTMKQVLEEPVELTRAEVDNDQKLDEHILRHLTSIYHFLRPCRMASPENRCVVDQSRRGVWYERNQSCRCEHLPSGASEQYHVDDSQICRDDW